MVVNESGEIVFDTLIKIEDLTMISVKPGKKTTILQIAKERAPTVEEVRAKIIELLKGRKVIGYHTKNKLKDLGVFEDLDGSIQIVNCSTMLHKGGKGEPQMQMKTMCADYLNLQFNNRPYPYAVFITL